MGSWHPISLAAKKPEIEKKQCCNKFNKDFKNGPHQKKKKWKTYRAIYQKGEELNITPTHSAMKIPFIDV